MFTIEDRARVRERVLQLAHSDRRVTAGAVVGSLALSDGDRWSDLDLTFGVADEFSIFDVLDDLTKIITTEFDAAHLFDLPSGPSIYRVFLLPGCLQFDMSFTPASKFGATSPKFKLLFGNATEREHTPEPSAQELFGYAVHHALRARFCIERGKFWQAEYWINETRNCALSLACLRNGLSARYCRGFDDLPNDVLYQFAASLTASLDRGGLLRAFEVVVEGFLTVAEGFPDLAEKVKPQLRELMIEWDR